jgi:hypothetical protein
MVGARFGLWGGSRTWLRSAAVGTLLIASACGGDPEQPGARYNTRDSASVTIIDALQPQWSSGEEWTVHPIPLVSIGAIEGDSNQLFTTIVGAGVLKDGSIFVGDSGARTIRLYDGAGKFMRAMGGHGSGPGEFRYLLRATACGGAIVAQNWNGGIVVFNNQGTMLRQFSISEPGKERSPYSLGCGQTGEFTAVGWGDFNYESYPEKPTPRTATSPVWLFDTLGVLVANLGTFVSSERIFLPSPEGGGGTDSPHPLGRAARFAIRDDAIVVGDAAAISVSLIDRSGKLIAKYNGVAEDLRVTPADLDAYMRAPSVRRDSTIRSRLSAAGWPGVAAFPAYDQILVDPEGNIWLDRYDPPWRDDPRWGVFRSDGVFLGHVVVPPGLTVFEIGTDYIIGARKNEMDVQAVAKFRLQRGTGG